MTAARPLTGAEIIELVAEVPQRLEPGGTQHVVVIVGGSLLAWRGLRASTEDVDSVTRFDDELRRAVEQVAAAHDLPSGWLNDNAATFLPATFERGDCDVLMDHPRLLVLGARLEVVFVMKVYRADPNDQADRSPSGHRRASAAPKKSSTPSSRPTRTPQRTLTSISSSSRSPPGPATAFRVTDEGRESPHPRSNTEKPVWLPPGGWSCHRPGTHIRRIRR